MQLRPHRLPVHRFKAQKLPHTAKNAVRSARSERLSKNDYFVIARAHYLAQTPSIEHRRARPLGAPVQELPNAYKFVRLYCPPLTRNGDVCERRLRRIKRAKRSGRIKAIGKRALHAMTEPLIQQGEACPIPTAVYRCRSRLRLTRSPAQRAHSGYTPAGSPAPPSRA